MPAVCSICLLMKKTVQRHTSQAAFNPKLSSTGFGRPLYSMQVPVAGIAKQSSCWCWDHLHFLLRICSLDDDVCCSRLSMYRVFLTLSAPRKL